MMRFQPLQASILLVDDRPANLLALEAVLRPLGHRLVPANSGEDALKHLLGEEFAVILMDVQMPGLDGYETVALIKQRERCRQVPILFITALNKDVEHVIKGYTYGAVDYILKPIEPFVLRAKVAAFVDLYLKEQQIRVDQEKLRQAEREAQARRSEERFRSLTESMPLCVWATDTSGRIQYCNRAWVEYTGMSAEQSAGLGVMRAIHPEQRDAVERDWKDSVRAGRAFETEFLLQDKEGVYRWHLCRAVPQREEKGAVIGWIATATDIDAQKRVEEDRARVLEAEQRARELAEFANQSKDQFLAILSHELRNPLNAILGWARMLRSGKLDSDRVVRALSAIERNAEAQAKLVEDLLDISRIVAGKLRLQHHRESFGRVVRAAVDTVKPEADAKGVHLEVTLGAGSDEVLADTDRLQQVVWNLLSNAIKFTPSGGRVSVEVHDREGEVELRITDTGVGIADHLLPHIFERFRQADSTTTRAHSGLGLGLAIARHLIDLHGGSVHAESPGEGKGATFIVRLPMHAGNEEQPAGSETHDSADGVIDAPSLHGLRILFVDDQADARELVAELLELYGAKVVVADSAASALKALDETRPDVLVSDIGMPDEDGYQLIRKIRARGDDRGGNIPAVAVTGFASSFDNQLAISEGFQCYLAKPIDPNTLLSVVAKLSGRPSKSDGARSAWVSSRV
jgi:PAS domain S-box-containing protein